MASFSVKAEPSNFKFGDTWLASESSHLASVSI